MFLNPLMLAGLAGAALPLVLHLLNRVRFREIQWGAMMFLPGAEVRQRRAIEIRQIILLLIRMAAVAALAVALARPVLAGRWAAIGERPPACTVLLLDCSASMSYESNGVSRLDAARRAAMNVVESMSGGDELALIEIGETDLSQPPAPSTDLRSQAKLISDAAGTAARSDMAAALESAAMVLGQSQCVDRQIVIVTDRQASSWDEVNEEFAATFRAHAAMDDPLKRTRLLMIPVGGDETDNVLIESITIPTGPILRDVTAQAEIRLHNFADVARSDLPIGLFQGSREIDRRNITLPPRSSASVRIPFKMSTAGSHMLNARILGSNIPGANERYDWVVDAHEPLRVLLISGDETEPAEAASRSSSSAASFIRAALAPYKSADEPGADIAVIETIDATIDPRPSVDRARCDVAILDNIARPDAVLVGRLEQFLHEGGGVLIALGNLAVSGDYNTTLYRDGAGLMPARIGPPSIKESDERILMAWADAAHPAFAYLNGLSETASFFSDAHLSVNRYFPATISGDARVIAKFESGDPLLIERLLGRGRVMLATAPFDVAWGEMPRSNLFLPMMQSIVRYLAGGSEVSRNINPGDPIIANIENPTGDKPTLTLPDGTRQSVDVDHVGDEYRVRWNDTRRVGRYELRYRSARGRRQLDFQVHKPPKEEDPTPLTEQQWNRLQGLLGLQRVNAEKLAATGGAAMQRAAGGNGSELWLPLIATVGLLLLAETILARRWSAAASIAAESTFA